MINKINISIKKVAVFYIFFLSLALLFFPGCDEPLTSDDLSGPINKKTNANVAIAKKVILDAITDSNPRIRAKAVEIVASTKQRDFMPYVQKLLKDDFVPVRFLAALTVGELNYRPASRDIQKLLKDEDRNVQIAAAYAAEKLHISKNALKTLTKAAKSQNQTVRANAALLLGKRGNKDAIEILNWIRNSNDSDDKSRFQAAEAIARLGDNSIYPKLWTMILSPYNDVRIMGIEAMAALATIEAQNALITMLDDEILEVRLAAAQHLGELGNNAGEPEVLDVFEKALLNNLDQIEQKRVKSRTAMAIGCLCTDRLKKYLPRLINDESALVRLAAAKAVLLCDNANGGF